VIVCRFDWEKDFNTHINRIRYVIEQQPFVVRLKRDVPADSSITSARRAVDGLITGTSKTVVMEVFTRQFV